MTVDTQTSQGIKVSVQHNTGHGKVSLFSPAAASVVITVFTSVIIGYTHVATVEVDMGIQPTVNVGMVYTSTVTDDIEMWWCDNWRVLWNKKTKVLWQEG